MKKKKLKKFTNEINNFKSEIEDDEHETSIIENDEYDENNSDNLKGASIEIKGEGSRLKGKIIQIKETKNSVIIIFKSKWGDLEELNLYFDEFEELKDNKRANTMDGEIFIS